MAIITISRGTFSGGSALAERVAKRLGYPCVSREMILEETAFRSHVAPDEVASAIEKRPSFWQRMMGQRTTYLTLFRAALCEHARDGRLVYHGHIGHLLLPGIAHVLRVRVTADMERRIQAAMMQFATREAALAHIERVDRERREWSRFLFGVDWDDPLLYDIVVNVGRLSLDGACNALIQLADSAEFRATPESARALQDLILQSRVAAALSLDERTSDAEVTVTAADGRVTIIGKAAWPDGIEAVKQVAEQVKDVESVECRLSFLSVRYANVPVA